MIDKLFSFSLRNKTIIIRLFQLVYLVQVAFLLIGGRAIYYDLPSQSFFYTRAVWSGRIGLIIYIITTLPGIFRRFSVHHKSLGIILLFRRYIGILTFLFLVIHFWFIRGIMLFLKGLITPLVIFEVFGSLSYFMLLGMFLTSNDWSVRNLGKYWQYIHNFTYIAIWFMFLHTALQRLSIWSVSIGIFALLQLSSHIYAFFTKKEVV